MKLACFKLTRNIIVILCFIVMHGASFASPNMEGIQVYQKNLHLSEAHKQKLASDIDRYHNAGNLWVTLRHEFSLPHYEENPAVQEKVRWFMNHREYLNELTTRAAPYLYFILQQVRKRHLPAELVLLPMIESDYNPFAYSSAGAAGIWQLLPGTASGFGVKRDWWYDGRRDVVASTRAALGYLAYLGNFFEGNWLLATAAYDTGEGNILSAVKKNIRKGKSTDFWSLPVAHETRDYVPRLLALAIIISHPERYPVHLPNIPNAPYLAQVDVGVKIDMKQAATLASMNLKDLKKLNPAYNASAAKQHGPSKLILPIQNVEEFTENLSRSPHFKNLKTEVSSNEIASNEQVKKNNEPVDLATSVLKNIQEHYVIQPGDTLYMVRKGDTVEKIAKRFHTDAQIILTTNKLKHKKITAGDKLVIPTHVAQQFHKPELAPGDTIYMVRKNDDIEKIAKKFHTSAAAIRVSNLLTSDELKENDRLIIPKRIG